MEQLLSYLPLILPIFVIELALAITALVHVVRHPHYKFGSRPVWIILVLFVQIIGPIVYFIFGKGEEE